MQITQNIYAVLSGGQQTKHYYIGSERVASRVSALPAGEFSAEATPELSQLSESLKSEAEYLASEAGLPPIEWTSQTSGEEDCEEKALELINQFELNSRCYATLMQAYQSAMESGISACEFYKKLLQ